MRLSYLQTSFVGQQFQFLPICASTNAEAHAELVKNDATPEGLTILADEQTAGRGQRGNAWQAAAGENLTFSVVLRPTFLPVGQQFALSIAVALAGFDTLRAVLGRGVAAWVKWPNDLYVGNRKVGGVLIENTVRGNFLASSIVGIGLNVNQTAFGSDLGGATSLALEAGWELDREQVLTTLLGALEARYLALRGGAAERQQAEYLARLYRYGEQATFGFEGRTAAGRITGVDERGQLVVALAEGERAFGVQEVRFLD